MFRPLMIFIIAVFLVLTALYGSGYCFRKLPDDKSKLLRQQLLLFARCPLSFQSLAQGFLCHGLVGTMQ